MTYTLTLTRKPEYLHVRVTGENTAENVSRYMTEVGEHCRQLGCGSVLVEENLEGPRLGMSDVFKVTAEGSKKAPAVIERMAYVDANIASNVEMMKFAETVAVNRGLHARVFATVAEAEAWLLSEIRAGKKGRKGGWVAKEG